jgi:hypothetical protein
MRRAPVLRSLGLVLMLALAAQAEEPTRVTLLRLPEGTYQPQALVDRTGTVHVVALKGDPGAAEVVYRRLDAHAGRFGPEARVSGRPGTAVAVGSIRGAQVALGRDGRLHVCWNGSDAATPKNPFGGAPLLYTRSNPERTAFETPRNLMARTSVLDGGGSVAADGAGNVVVAWHGSSEDAIPGESGRQLWIARSSDDGATFAPETPALAQPTGACACCGVKALADRHGNLAFLFRTAGTSLDRDLALVASIDRGATFSLTPISSWHIKTCPMSRAAMIDSPAGILAAWEAEDHVYYARLDPRGGLASKPVAPPGEVHRRHPSLAINPRGEVLLAWAEGTGWKQGGDLVWQLFDAQGRPASGPHRVAGGIPVWGIPSAVARPDGSFLIIH